MEIVAIRIPEPEHPTTISQCQLLLFAERFYSVPAGSDVDLAQAPEHTLRYLAIPLSGFLFRGCRCRGIC